MRSERLGWLLGLLVLAAGGWWLSTSTEWVEVDRWRRAQGEARENPLYAFEQLLRRLGMTVAHHEALDAMPPPQARLVLLSNDWELVPERAEQLHRWVLGGGHLVLTRVDDWDDTALAKWVPVDALELKRQPVPKAAVAASAASAASASEDDEPEIPLVSTPALWGDTQMIANCGNFPDHVSLRAKPRQAVTWALTLAEAPRSTHVLRVSLGQGSVTVLNTGRWDFHNHQALDCENPLLLAAALQAEPGATAWIYLNERRDALLPWLWQTGWIAIIAALLALAMALWRAAVRFGPRLAPAPRLRRSISEQVRGLGAYLLGGGREALLAAQQRALNEQATRSLPRFVRLPVAERASAVAAATDLSAHELSTAMTARFCTRVELTQHLQVLETARRRLRRTSDERPAP